MKTMEEAEREAHGYWFDRAEKAERERDEARATIERVKALVERWRDAEWRTEIRTQGRSSGDVIAGEADKFLLTLEGENKE